MTKYLPLALLPLLLGACSASPPPVEHPGVPAEAMRRFVDDMQTVLRQQMAWYNARGLVGAVELKVTLNRQRQPTACSANAGKPELVSLLPAGTSASDARVLEQLTETQCWLTAYPAVPDALYEADGTVEIVAPIILMPRPLPVAG